MVHAWDCPVLRRDLHDALLGCWAFGGYGGAASQVTFELSAIPHDSSVEMVGPKELSGGRGVWYYVSGIHVCVVPVSSIDDAAFTQILEDMTIYERDHTMKGTISYYGFPIGAKHRKIGAEMTAKSHAQKPHTRQAGNVMLTDSALIRGAMTAFNWLVPSVHMAGYAPKNWRAASRWLQQFAPHDEEELGRALCAAFDAFGLSLDKGTSATFA
jgi:hypothetical protein